MAIVILGVNVTRRFSGGDRRVSIWVWWHPVVLLWALQGIAQMLHVDHLVRHAGWSGPKSLLDVLTRMMKLHFEVLGFVLVVAWICAAVLDSEENTRPAAKRIALMSIAVVVCASSIDWVWLAFWLGVLG